MEICYAQKFQLHHREGIETLQSKWARDADPCFGATTFHFWSCENAIRLLCGSSFASRKSLVSIAILCVDSFVRLISPQWVLAESVQKRLGVQTCWRVARRGGFGSSYEIHQASQVLFGTNSSWSALSFWCGPGAWCTRIWRTGYWTQNRSEAMSMLCLPVKGLRSFQALIFFLVPGVVALWYRRLSKQISAARAKHRFPQWGEINDKS